MLNRKTPLTLATDITFVGTSSEDSANAHVVYYNRNDAELEAKTKELNDIPGKDAAWVNRELFIYIVQEFNGQEPTHDGIKELESNWPGATVGVFTQFHVARRVEVVKNSKPQ